MGKFYSTTIQKGSQGSDVKEWQTFLNSQGYNLAVDGDFGDKTLAATTEWQAKNGLGADGIVGKLTWGKAGYSNISTPTSRPSIDPTPTNPTYDYGRWDDSTKGSSAKTDYDDAKSAVDEYAKFIFSDQEWLNTVKENIKDYGDFTYDLNGDALYQQYKDKYIQQGKLAMGDAIGQASAMTGGYGNSYAQSVGQQAYQNQLDNLNDIVPELYQMALDKYNMGLDNLYNQYGLLSSERDNEYGLHQDGYSRLLDKLGIAKDDYYSGADMFYTEQGNKNSALGQEFSDEMSIWEAETDNAWREYDAEEDSRRYETEQNAKAVEEDDQPQKEPDKPATVEAFTGSTYNEAVSYVTNNGVPNEHAAGIMTASEWNRRRASYKNSGTGGAEVKNYSSYQEYLAAITEYLIEQYR